jgi:localization factor PodJL
VGEIVLPVAPVPSLTAPEVDSTPVTDVAETVAPRVIPMVDSSLSTGSIDPAAAAAFEDAAAQPIPEAFAPAADATEVAAINPAETDLPATITAVTEDQPATDVAAVDPAVVTPAAPALFDMPPEGLGPIELRQAAAAGDPRAQFEVAAIFTEGRAVPQDLAAAATWYERAATQGFAPAEYRLGNLYENGRGVTKDLEQARLWYQRAAEAGNRMSMHNLAALYAGGELGEQDFASAAKWFEEAANQGMTDSQFNLGMLYARGLGVTQDLEASFKWFSLASLSGDVDAAKSRDDIAKSLTAEQVSTISAGITGWKAAPINFASNFAPIGTWNPTFDPGPVIDKKEVVVGVQTLLTRLGYDVGTADGFAGPRTGEAIKAFERATGMSETGQINPRLLAVLSSQPV